MAITKIHPIKSTLKKAIDYIVDPAKTDDKLLVSSFGCAVETADLEFEKTRLLAMQKGNNLAHQLIQAFEPGEVSYAQAHEIGRQLADEILGGKYEYVIATHINKEHCHTDIWIVATELLNLLWNADSFRSFCPSFRSWRISPTAPHTSNVSDLPYTASPFYCTAFFVKEQRAVLRYGTEKGEAFQYLVGLFSPKCEDCPH